MLQVEMNATVRSATGKGAMRRLRSEGQTPAVVYGAGSEATPLALETKQLMANLLNIYRRNAIVTLKIDDGTEKNVVVKEVQTDPVHDTLLHTDFCVIDLETPQTFKVPVVYTGSAKGTDLGGVLTVAADNVFLKGCPLDIPDEVKLDVSGLNIGDQLTFSAIDLSDKVELVSDADAVCVSVIK